MGLNQSDPARCPLDLAKKVKTPRLGTSDGKNGDRLNRQSKGLGWHRKSLTERGFRHRNPIAMAITASKCRRVRVRFVRPAAGEKLPNAYIRGIALTRPSVGLDV
ncbi:MAG: hypothetical protein EBS53_09355 [Bacteroidetes bacterium]|nr:hypothetical protein [Bacteroidota bacterium]